MTFPSLCLTVLGAVTNEGTKTAHLGIIINFFAMMTEYRPVKLSFLLNICSPIPSNCLGGNLLGIEQIACLFTPNPRFYEEAIHLNDRTFGNIVE